MGFLTGLGQGIQNLPNTLGAALYPVDPQTAATIPPEQLTAMRRMALIRAGLGFSAASQQNAGFGAAALTGIDQGAQPFQQGIAGILQQQAAAQAKIRQDQLDKLEADFKNSGTYKNYAEAQKALTPPEPKSLVGNVNPGDFTPESMAKFTASKNYGDLVPVPKVPTQKDAPAPTLTEILDPADSTRMLKIDARLYRGGSLGAPGVIGLGGKEPTSGKAEASTSDAKNRLMDLTTSLRDYYGQLAAKGGITDTTASSASNIAAGVKSSAVGQFAGRMVGTDEQSLRNQIKQQRPLLLNAIRQATGMSARQMDSNAELKMYLAAATDPTLDVQANLSALDKIEQLYGVQTGASPAAQNPSAPAAAKRTVVRTGTLNGKKVVQYSDGTTDYAP